MMRNIVVVLVAAALLSGCVIQAREVSDENCGKMLVSRSTYLQCIESKDVSACDHLLRLYQTDVQVFVASGCASTKPGVYGVMQAPTW